MIDANQREAYERDGVVCLRSVFDAQWLSIAAEAIEQGLADSGPMYVDYSADTLPGTYCGDFWIWQKNQPMRKFIFDSPAAQVSGELMNVDSVMLVTDNWLVRAAGAVNKAPWHHDGPYFDLDGRWCVLWMALEPVGLGEGVVFLKGSHRWGRLFMPESFAGTGPKSEILEPYEIAPDFTQDLERFDVAEYELEPGDCLVFDALTVHGAPSPQPQSADSRRFTMRFAEADSVYRPRGPWTLDMTAFLEEEYGLAEGGPYQCELLPVLWSRSMDQLDSAKSGIRQSV